MLARIAYTTYFTGIGASGLYCANKDFEARKKYEQEEELDIVKPMISEFIRFNGKCGIGFALGLCFGVMWPIAAIGKTFSTLDELITITKNN